MEKILVLGGTQFIGRNLVESLIKKDKYHITLFNRGNTNADLFPSLSKIKGDRNTDDISLLANEEWDYIIDVSCYYPNSLQMVLNSLKRNPKKYIYISTCSVYDHRQAQETPMNEETVLLECTDEQRTDKEAETYGNRKAECDRILMASGLNHVILRPALVYGQYDHTDRLYYWLYQARNYGKILLPDNGVRKFSITYVHDLVQIMVQSLSADYKSNVYNIVSEPATSIRSIVESAIDHFNTDPNFINATPAFLKENGIGQWMDMPLWIDGDFFTFSNYRMKEDIGIPYTEFYGSIIDSIQYYNDRGWNEPKYGMSEATRQRLIAEIEKSNSL